MLLRDDQEYGIHFGDSISHMAEMEPKSVDLAVFSPPFPSTFSYTSMQEDMGNSEDLSGEGKLHFQWFFRSLLKVMKPGRVAAVHCAQVHRLKRSGESGVYDFRGLLIRLAVRAGFVYDYDWVIRKNPQAQAIRTRKWELKFQGLEMDSTVSRGAMPDYLIKLRAPGDNLVPVKAEGNVTRNQWIDWAECCWSDIRETDTLNVKEARDEEDVKHVAPLQLDLIERLVRLYSNPGEIVFSPFAGIGSELYTALKLGRRAYGCEIKDKYHRTAIKNCERAIAKRKQGVALPLFDGVLEEAS